MGHQAGDEFLIELAKGLRNIFKENDVVGRIGGDEFFAFMNKTPDTAGAEAKAEEMIQIIRKVCAKYPSVNLSGSIGISFYPEHGKSVEELYAKADDALYQAKRQGKDKIVIAE